MELWIKDMTYTSLQKKKKLKQKKGWHLEAVGIELGSPGQGNREQSHWGGLVLLTSYIFDGTRGNRDGLTEFLDSKFQFQLTDRKSVV